MARKPLTPNCHIFSPAGHNATITDTVPLTSLFQDPDTPGARLNFSVSGTQAANLTVDNAATRGDTSVYDTPGGVLIFEAESGKVTYLSDQYQGHDGAGGAANDGLGNVLRLNVGARDTGTAINNTGGDAVVSLQINVAPTDITFRHHWETGETAYNSATDNNNDANNAVIVDQTDTSATNGEALYRTAYGTTDLPEISITENVEHTGEEVLAVLDVQDENRSGSATARGHKFGTHEITVSGDDRFVISKTGGDDARQDADSDGSTWELRVVKGATFDYETDDADGDRSNGVQIVLTFSATDGGGLSTPTPNPASWIYVYGAANLHKPIQLLVTITNDTSDDKPRLNPNTETPGLKDDSSDDDNNDRTDGDDRDTDGGGTTPPPPGMSLGGIIEDFIDNMDQGEQDLLEDYLLTIDDGLDIV